MPPSYANLIKRMESLPDVDQVRLRHASPLILGHTPGHTLRSTSPTCTHDSATTVELRRVDARVVGGA